MISNLILCIVRLPVKAICGMVRLGIMVVVGVPGIHRHWSSFFSANLRRLMGLTLNQLQMFSAVVRYELGRTRRPGTDQVYGAVLRWLDRYGTVGGIDALQHS